VKDALAYVRLAMHPEDDISLLRVLNVPPRGIGKTTLDAVQALARADSSVYGRLSRNSFLGGCRSRGSAPYAPSKTLSPSYSRRSRTASLRISYVVVLDETGYMEMLKDRNAPEDVSRIENLEELVRAVAEGIENGESFSDFLDAAALVVTQIPLKVSWHHIDYTAQHKGLGIRSCIPHRYGGRHLASQPRVERRKRY